MRWFISAVGIGVVLTAASAALPQNDKFAAEQHSFLRASDDPPILDEISFIGLRHIAPEALAAHIQLHVGYRFDASRAQRDVRLLARLGWFDSIQVVITPSNPVSPAAQASPRHATLLFRVHELPFLSRVEYSGSRLLSAHQIEKLLEEKELSPPLGKPADPVVLHRIASAIRSSLNELGHPQASVQIRESETPHATVFVQFIISDGPLLPVRQVSFIGNPQLPSKVLSAQMRSIMPRAFFVSLRGKDAYTPQAFEEDSQRILSYYQNHGYPEARIGLPRANQANSTSLHWTPWPHEAARSGLSLVVPVEAGPYYAFASIGATEALRQAAGERSAKLVKLSEAEDRKPYSAKETESLRRLWMALLRSNGPKTDSSPNRGIDLKQTLDSEKHLARVGFDLSDSPPYTVQRIEFTGLHKFSDRYVRRRILLREGRPVDDRALELGLARLARTGYFKPIRKEDIHVRMDEPTHTANVSIHIQEIGQQRASLVGGHAQFGSTLGIAYTVFDFLEREELLSAHLEGGPESVQIALGLAKDGIFGTRASLAFSIFYNVIRPRFARGTQGPFFSTRSDGFSVPFTYALTSTDSIGLNYTLSHTASDEQFGTPPGLTGLPPIDLRSHVSSRALGTAWAHDTGNARTSLSGSASGGILGGDENILRSSGEYARIFRDPLFASKNAWAFRITSSAAGSYSGNTPFYSRFFSGDEFVRGLRTGELGPFAMTERILPSGATTSSPSFAGANLITATNAEYRIPLQSGAEAVGFFDLGSGWLLPNWLGPTKPNLLSATNGVLHGSTGVELRWTIPGIQVPVRSYYAINVLRLDRRIRLADKSLFFARNRFGAFGWGLGSLF
ncbi:MAG TPA: POTRA domain-containing protein [Candidatus Acidoferrum sp.]|nr:POTRA domain-containing protein [Candidatus Acidoferrum sp.]